MKATYVFIVVGASQPLPSFQGLPFAISIRVIKDRKEEIYEKEGNRTGLNRLLPECATDAPIRLLPNLNPLSSRRGLLSYKGLGFPESDLLTSIIVIRRAQLVY